MRLLQLKDDKDISLVEYFGKPPPYAILSHTWGADDDEVTFKDLSEARGKDKKGYRKLLFCGQQAALHGLEYFWVDTCCIDKSSSAELTEAINSMFRWYEESARCYVYLADVSASSSEEDGMSRWKPSFRKCRWFTRGWTLQELIAPKSVEFYSSEGHLLGNKLSLKETLHDATGIALKALESEGRICLDQFSVEERMLWAAKRTTKREEDAAYSLLGLFKIHMPLIYGEGRQGAFNRLQKEIRERSNESTVEAHVKDHSWSEELEKIQKWLSPVDPSTNYQKALKQRQANTGLWFLKSDRYAKWKTEPGSFLWLYGIPGAGKTILSSTILHDLQDSCQQDSNKAIIYFYFDFNDSQKQHTEAMHKSLIIQILQQSKEIPPRLRELYSLHVKAQRQPPADALLTALGQLIESFLHVYIVLDALDECADREELMETLALLSRWRLPSNHLIVTSRREWDIEQTIQRIASPQGKVCLESKVVDEDIRQYIRQRLVDDQALRKWRGDSTLLHEIETALIQGSQGMYVVPLYTYSISLMLAIGFDGLCANWIH
jgi:hypothetical protein